MLSNNLAGEENQAILFVILKQQKLKGKQQIINIILTLYSKSWGFLIRIRPGSRAKGVKLDSNTISPQWSLNYDEEGSLLKIQMTETLLYL